MADIRPRFAPVGRSFRELNLRTYVRDADGARGVYFFTLDADDRLGVTLARRLFRLPYHSAEMAVSRNGEVRFRSRRRGTPPARFDATYAPDGESFVPEAGSLPAFLTERYRFYTASDDGTLYYGDIAHGSWALSPARADIRENGLFAANGFDRPPGDPLLHYGAGIDVTAGRVHRVHK